MFQITPCVRFVAETILTVSRMRVLFVADSAVGLYETRRGRSQKNSARISAEQSGGTAIRSVSIVKPFIPFLVPTAVNLLLHMGTKGVSIAVINVTLMTDLEWRVTVMNNSYRANLESYLASMLQAKKMLSMGILTPEDYAVIDTIIADKYGISSCSIYRGIDLIYSGFRGNISHYKEVTECQRQ